MNRLQKRSSCQELILSFNEYFQKMFKKFENKFEKFDLSLVLAPAASQVEYENRQSANGKFTIGKRAAPSPGRTVRTHTSSSSCSENNKNSDQNSFEQGISRTSSNKSKFSWISEKAPSLVEIFDSMRPESNDVPANPLPQIRRSMSPESIKRKGSGFSSLGKNASSALKHLRKNMSLVTAMSFDSETSNKRSRMMKKINNTRKAFATMHHDASVKVFEAFQGFEITRNSDECDVSYTYSADESDLSNTEFGRNYEILVPRVIREMPPDTATPQRTYHFGEEKSCEDDADIRKLCNLMKRIRTKSIHDNVNVASSIGRVESFDVSDVSELDEIDFRVTNETAPCRTPDCFDLMVFVNNEHEVLEYAPDDFEGYQFK